MINWMVKNQKSVALSTMEAEYMALCEASKEALYLRYLTMELHQLHPKDPVILLEDNIACKLISTDAKHHSRAKHIDVQYHFSRECHQNGLTKVIDVHTQRQLADYLTKYLDTVKLYRLCYAAFGYSSVFHSESPELPLVPMNQDGRDDKTVK